jgi:hypothetical protein
MNGANLENTFMGVPLTNHGENRIAHCIKYDLTGFARLVTVVNNGLCIFLYAGEHDTVDRWLDRNRGLDFLAAREGQTVVLEKVRATSGRAAGRMAIHSESYIHAMFDPFSMDYSKTLSKIFSVLNQSPLMTKLCLFRCCVANSNIKMPF